MFVTPGNTRLCSTSRGAQINPLLGSFIPSEHARLGAVLYGTMCGE